MRLGFWNRLAIVAFVVGVVGIPTWWVLSTNYRLGGLQESAYAACTAAADRSRDRDARQVCWDVLLDGPSRFYGWREWWDAALASAIGLAIVYLIILAGVQTARWVWRGRISN